MSHNVHYGTSQSPPVNKKVPNLVAMDAAGTAPLGETQCHAEAQSSQRKVSTSFAAHRPAGLDRLYRKNRESAFCHLARSRERRQNGMTRRLFLQSRLALERLCRDAELSATSGRQFRPQLRPRIPMLTSKMLRQDHKQNHIRAAVTHQTVEGRSILPIAPQIP